MAKINFDSVLGILKGKKNPIPTKTLANFFHVDYVDMEKMLYEKMMDKPSFVYYIFGPTPGWVLSDTGWVFLELGGKT